jgi:crossover junction endodeoxyribonuclease RuvC
MIILGIDPGIARVGWGVIQEDKGKKTAIDFGLFETASTTDLDIRLLEVHHFLTKIIQKFKPDVLAIEQLYFGANAKTALIVGQARGVIILTAAQNNIKTASYTPLQVKMALTGYGRAEKKQIQVMVKSELKLTKPLTQDDTADALAIALTHAFSYKLHGKMQSK